MEDAEVIVASTETELNEIEAELNAFVEEERELNNDNQDYSFFYFEDDNDWSQHALLPKSCVTLS